MIETDQINQWQIAQRLIRGQIVDGEFAPGEKLGEVQLARSLGISRTPLREALVRLEEEGLLIKGKSGYSIREFTIAEVLDAIELRGIMEGSAARFAAQRTIEPDKLKAIKTTLSDIDLVLKYKRDGFEQLNARFHKQLANLSGSDLIEQEVLRTYRFPFADPSAVPSNQRGSEHFQVTNREGQRQHKKILRAIERKDADLAFKLMCDHAQMSIATVQAAYMDKARNISSTPMLTLVRI
ncbi:MAG: GntR family transcriptional regulator [Granulosicoccus sp.]